MRTPPSSFRVRSKTYAGGASVDVSWTDGPTTPRVEATAKLYQGANFNGSTDMKEYHDSLLSTEHCAEAVRFGADFVFCHRTLSPELQAEIETEIAELTGEPYDPCKAYQVAVLATPGTDEPHTLIASHHGTIWGADLLHQIAFNRPR
jgi:hypothetical protein